MENLKHLPVEKVVFVSAATGVMVAVADQRKTGVGIAGLLIFYQWYSKPKPETIYLNPNPPPPGGWAPSKYH